jgi:hypothetical protein
MMMLVRLWHHYIGFLIAPSLLFFAATGALQLFSLHEAHGDYQPPALVQMLANVHKDQVFRAKPPRGDGGAGSRRPQADDGGAAGDDDAAPNATQARAGAGGHHRHHDDDDATAASNAPASNAAVSPLAAPSDATMQAANVAAPPANAASAAPPAGPAAGPPAGGEAHGPKLGTLLLKWWFLAVALGLIVSTCLGLWIGLTHVRRKWTALALFVVGAAIPVVLLLV